MAHDMGRVFGRIIFRIAPALLLVLVYGVVNLVSMGRAPRHYWHTYVPLVCCLDLILRLLLDGDVLRPQLARGVNPILG